jgi:hypothetical protein
MVDVAASASISTEPMAAECFRYGLWIAIKRVAAKFGFDMIIKTVEGWMK